MALNNIQKRFALFLIGCIGLRSLFVIIAKNIDIQYLPYLGYLAILPVLGWAYILFIKPRDTGLETFGEKIWWNDLRYLHATLYAVFAYLAITKNPKAWTVLLADVVVGLSAFLIHHYRAGSFQELF
jgi:hypothetical protein